MSIKKEPWWELPVPARYVLIYLDVLRDRGLDPNTLLARTGLDLAHLMKPDAQVAFTEMQAVMDFILAETGDEGLGLDAGLKMPPTVFGNLGYALLCSETIEDVIRLCLRFWPLLGRGISVQLLSGKPLSSLEFSLLFPIPEYIRHISYEVTIASFYRGMQVLAENASDAIEIWFSMPAPPHAEKARALLGNVHYDMPVTRFSFPAELMKQPLPMHNPVGLKFALEQCEREMALLEGNLFHLPMQVQEQLVFGPGGYPSFNEISERMHMTPRTLRRRLEEEGTSFKQLLDEVKRRDAIQLLDDPRLDIQRVAELLGYQDPANFTRAFRKWTGQTPSQYRATRQASV